MAIPAWIPYALQIIGAASRDDRVSGIGAALGGVRQGQVGAARFEALKGLISAQGGGAPAAAPPSAPSPSSAPALSLDTSGQPSAPSPSSAPPVTMENMLSMAQQGMGDFTLKGDGTMNLKLASSALSGGQKPTQPGSPGQGEDLNNLFSRIFNA